jgi:hypothetical protein
MVVCVHTSRQKGKGERNVWVLNPNVQNAWQELQDWCTLTGGTHVGVHSGSEPVHCGILWRARNLAGSIPCKLKSILAKSKTKSFDTETRC